MASNGGSNGSAVNGSAAANGSGGIDEGLYSRQLFVLGEYLVPYFRSVGMRVVLRVM